MIHSIIDVWHDSKYAYESTQKTFALEHEINNYFIQYTS